MNKKRILFYYPSNKRSIQIETTFEEIKKLGHEIILLTTIKKGNLHHELERLGIKTFSHVSKHESAPFYYIHQIRYLIKFCKKNNINTLFSNLQHANFIAVFAQFFIQAKVICFRHHFKFSKGNFGIPIKINKTEQLFDKVINKLGKKIIVPSYGVYNGIQKFEKIDLNKLEVIPYLYDFTKYGSPNSENVEQIRLKYKAKLRIIMVARLIPFKRHLQVLPIIKKLINQGLDIQVLILDEGPEKKNIADFIEKFDLSYRIHLIGFTTSFLDYMKAADLLIHPSLTEASNNVIKEMGLMKKAVAVCAGVGDFDEYIKQGQNGYLMNIEHPEKDAENIILDLYDNPSKLNEIGSNLNQTVIDTFGSNELVIKNYIELINS